MYFMMEMDIIIFRQIRLSSLRPNGDVCRLSKQEGLCVVIDKQCDIYGTHKSEAKILK